MAGGWELPVVSANHGNFIENNENTFDWLFFLASATETHRQL